MINNEGYHKGVIDGGISMRYEIQDRIREIISKYIDIKEHFEYTNQELYGEDLKNMVNELLQI